MELEPSDGDPLAMTMEQASKNFERFYGRLKTASEREAAKWFGDRTTIIRPGLIVGPGDGSFRFTYWPYRIERGGEILAPGDGSDSIQIIDARDLAEWTIRMVENGTTGTFNATGPRAPLSMAEQLYGIRAAFDGNKDLRFTWVPADFLAEQQVTPWGEMPTWIPASDPEHVISKTDVSRAIAAGLTFRPAGHQRGGRARLGSPAARGRPGPGGEGGRHRRGEGEGGAGGVAPAETITPT